MRTFRNLRVSNLIQEELSKLFLEECDFGKAFVTIVSVEVDEDLKGAKIKLGIVPKEFEGEVMLYLERVKRVLQFKLGRAINIRPMPQIRFEVAKEVEAE